MSTLPPTTFDPNKYPAEDTEIPAFTEEIFAEKKGTEPAKTKDYSPLSLPANGLSRRKPDPFHKCFLGSFGLRVNYVFCSQIPTWASLS